MANPRRLPLPGDPGYEEQIAKLGTGAFGIKKNVIDAYNAQAKKYNQQMVNRENIAAFGKKDYVSATPEEVKGIKAESLDKYIQQGQLPPVVVQYVRDDILNRGIYNGKTQVNVPGISEPLNVQVTNGSIGNIVAYERVDGKPYHILFSSRSGKLTEQGFVQPDEGGFTQDLLPLVLAGAAAGYLAPAAGSTVATGGTLAGGTAAGAGTGAALSPYAAQAAGAYGGSAAAAQAAAAGSLAGIQAASTAQNALNLGIPTGGGIPTPAPSQVAGMSTNQISPLTPEVAAETTASASDIAANDALAKANQVAQAAGGFTPAAATGLLDSLGGVGSAILDFAKANPSIAGSLLGAVTGAIGAANAPKEATTQSNIDPQLKTEYLANIERAKQTAAGLEARQIAQPGQMYTDAEQKLYNLGMTPFGAADIERFYNPYQEQVVQGALSDIERARQMQEQENMARATAARSFGGSRQGVVSGMTNEAALRQSATTGGQLRQAGFNTAANLGLAARPLDIAGLQTSLGLGTTRTALEQARLDALRNLGTERLAITSGSLGIGIPNIGGSTSQPLYSNTAGSALSGGLTGAYIGSLLQPRPT